MAPRWSTKQELLCDSRASVPCCSGNNSARVANGERTNQEFSTDLPRRPPCAKRCQMKQDRMNKVYLPWCQFPPVSGFIWALQDFTSYDLVWSILCDILCDPVCISITCWHFSRCFGMFIVYKFLFVLKKKNNQSIFVKRFCIRQEDVTCELGATFHKAGVPHPFSHSSPSLTYYFGQVLLSWKLDSCPTFSQNKQ